MGYLRSKVMNFGAILIPSIVSLRDHSLVEQNISFNSKHCQSAHEGHGLVHTTDVFLTISSVSWFTESQSTLSRSHLLLPLNISIPQRTCFLAIPCVAHVHLKVVLMIRQQSFHLSGMLNVTFLLKLLDLRVRIRMTINH